MNIQRPVRRKTAKDFPQELLDLYDFYAHGIISKREFLEGAAKFAAVGVTAAMLLNQLSPDYALAQQVAPDDPEIDTSRITFPSPNGHGTVNAYLVRPAGADGKLPAVLVIHENRGLNPYIEDVTRRLGKAGFMAMAPDGLTSVGGYPGNDDEGRTLQRSVDREMLLNDFFAGFEYLLSRGRLQRQGGRRWLLLWRRRGQRSGGCLSGAGGRRAVLRAPAGSGGRGRYQGADADPERRTRRTHQCRLAGL